MYSEDIVQSEIQKRSCPRAEGHRRLLFDFRFGPEAA